MESFSDSNLAGVLTRYFYVTGAAAVWPFVVGRGALRYDGTCSLPSIQAYPNPLPPPPTHNCSFPGQSYGATNHDDTPFLQRVSQWQRDKEKEADARKADEKVREVPPGSCASRLFDRQSDLQVGIHTLHACQQVRSAMYGIFIQVVLFCIVASVL